MCRHHDHCDYTFWKVHCRQLTASNTIPQLKPAFHLGILQHTGRHQASNNTLVDIRQLTTYWYTSGDLQDTGRYWVCRLSLPGASTIFFALFLPVSSESAATTVLCKERVKGKELASLAASTASALDSANVHFTGSLHLAEISVHRLSEWHISTIKRLCCATCQGVQSLHGSICSVSLAAQQQKAQISVQCKSSCSLLSEGHILCFQPSFQEAPSWGSPCSL